ncbi:MAG: biopolymer transporter ExbD [Gammaproteobacteria bacterium]|jgi:biopolymer transport protein ExbD|nr:biopolymer transporter ExbD [Gammaproteobacteria bacterium]NBR17223.1 biopolymer transporter ExbD [Gammaproteobacteria bacterium]NCW21409.1 biopolymer transporter ExbD [Gammaproteobacteria bacterium]NCW57024.1 biopolymer transporter ExbD [Gammaproteobacteria bacterium]NDB24324.1 biopolymer transporter ExbD [Gammaproteobacteria bacterium]
MAMSVGSGSGEGQLNSTINTTPLVDVMLVLLIIFLITIPVITKTVKVSLPKAANIATQTKPENITVAVDSQGNIYWNNEQVASRDQLIEMIKIEAVKDPQPEIHIRGDANARFEDIGKVIYSVQRGGIVKVGFITEPDRGIRGSR